MSVRRTKIALVSLAFSGLLASSAFAHPGNGHGNAGMHGGFGGNPDSHISAQGLANGNGANASERLFGRDRAEFRHNLHNTAHHRLRHKHGYLHNASLHGPKGGKSASHISARGLANTNGPNAKHRVFGTDRAKARADLRDPD